MMKILLFIITIIMIEWICSVVYIVSSGVLFKSLYHDIFGWHVPDDGEKEYDGVNVHAHCKHCGKEIMQDSQGNWF